MFTIIKKTVKKIFPAAFLKEAFLIVNKIKIQTIDRLLFPEFKIKTNTFLVYRNGFPFRESKISLDDLPEGEVKRYMNSWYEWTQEEFLVEFNQRCWIEPEYGWAIVEPNKLLYYSLGVSRTWFQQKPSLMRFLRRKNVVHVSNALSLRDSGEENYFHFYNDVLTKIFYALRLGIAVTEIPVIISKKLWDKPYFVFYYKHSPFLQSLQWIVQQDDQYIQCDSVIFCKPLTHRIDLWIDVLAPLKKLSIQTGSRKIFLTRSKSRLRFIENANTIEMIVRKFGFEVIDTDNLTPYEQLNVFSSAEFLVGIHGAGLTNMMFRSTPCYVLELFPPPDRGYLPYHYILLAGMKQFAYRAIIGKPGRVSYSGGFYLEAENFEKELKEFL